MFILTERYWWCIRLPNKENVKTVHMFEQKDDAVRYLTVKL